MSRPPLQLRRGLKSNLPSTGAEGQPFYCTDTHELFVFSGGAMRSVGTNLVTSVATKTGAVTLVFSDIGGAASSSQLPLPTLSNIGAVKALAATAKKYLTSIGTDGIPVAAQPQLSDLSDTPAANLVVASPNGSSGALTARALVGSDLPADPGSVLLPYPYGTVFGVNAASSFNAGQGPNKIVCWRFVLYAAYTVKTLRCNVGTLVAATFINAAIYSADGLTKLVDFGTNPIDSSTTGDKAVTLTNAVVLPPGEYIFAQTCTSNSVLCSATKVANGGTFIGSLSKPQMFLATTSMSSGVMPATVPVSSALTSNVGIFHIEPV